MRHALTIAITCLAAAALTACGDDGGPNPNQDAGPDADVPDAPDGLTTVAIIPTDVNRDVDLLFVVDNSGSMSEEQINLAASFGDLIAGLNVGFPGGLPNLHLGVISTNVGTGGVAIGGCTTTAQPEGDDGNLLTNGCAGLAGMFVSDIKNPDGSRTRNYTGDLSDLFTCMARLGTAGCGFEQPLESMFRALQPGRNPGFLRADALLAVVLLTDEDDCSAVPGGALFGDPFGTPTSALGPRTSFRCFEFGVQCDGDITPRALGQRSGCVPRTGSPYVRAIEPYVEYLRDLKVDPRDVVVSAIMGNVDEGRTANVVPDPDDATRSALEASCTSGSGVAFPAFRLRSFLEGFPNRNYVATICNDRLGGALSDVARQILEAGGGPCLGRDLRDTNPVAPGLQPNCQVTQFREVGGVRVDVVDLPACGVAPCWRLTPLPATCPSTIDHLGLEVERTGAVPPGTLVEVRCEVRAGF